MSSTSSNPAVAFARPTPVPVRHLLVYLTRRQVHRLFPRERERFPWFSKNAQGQVVDLRDRREVWPLRVVP